MIRMHMKHTQILQAFSGRCQHNHLAVFIEDTLTGNNGVGMAIDNNINAIGILNQIIRAESLSDTVGT